MEERELGLLEIKQRIVDKKDELGLKSFKRNPPDVPKEVPSVVMIESIDRILKRNSRSPDGYPCTRELEVIIEVVVNVTLTEIRALYRAVRSVVFEDGVAVQPQVLIQELRAEGPYRYGVPDIQGMQLILGMQYTDNGN